MKKFRRIAATAAATAALGAALTPAASAQNLGDLLTGAGQLNQVIDNFDCTVLREGLTRTGTANQDTTRSQLADSLRNAADLGAIDPVLGLAGTVYADRIADRALACGIVKADPQLDFLAQLQHLSSGFVLKF